MSDSVQLVSKSYHQNLLNEMHQMQVSGQLCDVTVQVDYQGHLEEFEAHKAVLAATSKFFKDIFLEENPVTKSDSKIVLQEMQTADFACFLEFVYTARVEVEKGRVSNMLQVAKKLQCRNLEDTCIQVVELNLPDLPSPSGTQRDNLSQEAEGEAETQMTLNNSSSQEEPNTETAGMEQNNPMQKTEKKESRKDEQVKNRRLSTRLAGRKVFVDIPKKKYMRKLKDQEKVSLEMSSQCPSEEMPKKAGMKEPANKEEYVQEKAVEEEVEAQERSDIADHEAQDVIEDDCTDMDFEPDEDQQAKDLEDGEEKKNKRGGLFSCETCQRGFQYEKSFLKHIKQSHGVMPEVIYRCNTCNQTFANRCNLKIHERHVHSDERLFPCDVCNKAFKRKKDVKRHSRQVHEGGGERHFCQQCGKALSSKTALILHERTHTGDRPYECPECKAKFSQTSALKTHRRTHTGEKPFSCDECGARFTQNHMLAYHKRCHSGEKPFMCESCGKSFASKEYLKHHSRIHTGSKPFKCEICSRAFAQRNSLHQHMKVHTGERPYHCNQCGKQFTQLNALQRHHRIHTGEKPYMCMLCNRTFTDKSTVRRHTMTHDKDTPWKNYLVVLQGNVESGHKKRMKQGDVDFVKQQDKEAAAAAETSDGQSMVTQGEPSMVAVSEQPVPVSIAGDWSSPGQTAIALVSHATLAGYTVIQTDAPETHLHAVVNVEHLAGTGTEVISLDSPISVACPVTVPVSLCTPVPTETTVETQLSEPELVPSCPSVPVPSEAPELNVTESVSVEAMEMTSEPACANTTDPQHT
ncbi:GDNF-inducible zinc finger protein 1 isoform X2 [Amia ocellicauda]